MILTAKKLWKEIENSSIPTDMKEDVFNHIHINVSRIKWETELMKLTLKSKGELKAYLEGKPFSDSDIHSDDHLHNTHNDSHAI